jgi:hypothetical protein
MTSTVGVIISLPEIKGYPSLWGQGTCPHVPTQEDLEGYETNEVEEGIKYALGFFS